MDNDKLLKIFGTEELVKSFTEMNNEVQTKILSTSFKKAATLIINEAQANLAGRYTHVSASLTTSLKKEYQLLNVGASKRKGGHLAHIAEAGTKERFYITKNGETHRTGKIIGNKFWSTANKTTETAVEETIYKNIKDQFIKILDKNNKK